MALPISAAYPRMEALLSDKTPNGRERQHEPSLDDR
jgi:hypothetical protein